MSAPAKIQTRIESHVTVVTLNSEYAHINEEILDYLRGDVLKTAEAADPPLMVLDLEQVQFFGSSFIEILFQVWRELERRPGGQLALSGLNMYCHEVLSVCHLDTLWRIYPDTAQAVEALTSAGRPA